MFGALECIIILYLMFLQNATVFRSFNYLQFHCNKRL